MNAIDTPASSRFPGTQPSGLPREAIPETTTELQVLAAQFKQALTGGVTDRGVEGKASDRETGDASEPEHPDALAILAAATAAQRDGIPQAGLTGGAGLSSAVKQPARADITARAPSAGQHLSDRIDPSQPAASLAGQAEHECQRTILASARDSETQPADPAGSDGDTLGAAMLQSLMNQRSATPVAAAETVAPAARTQTLESIVAATVSRVLVSDPLHDHRREVRLDFAKDVLPDTQVRLWREDGRLHVEFLSPPSVADAGLRDALPNLSQAIQQRTTESEIPVVMLRVSSTENGGQPGDGRSRQQYFATNDAEENA